MNSTPKTVSKRNVIEKPCRDWRDFKSKIIADQFPDGQFRKGRYLFRGQANYSWELSTTFDRWYKGPGSKKNEVAERLLSEFKKEAEYDLADEVRHDEMALRGLAQHHGLPTRLLDWSESPYVAAFFAFSGYAGEENRHEGRVAVWVLDSDNWIWSGQSGCSLEKVPTKWNERIRNQVGRFTYLRAPYSTLEEHVGNFGPGEVWLKKYSIPVSDFRFAMSELDAMGLTYSRIYPGLEGYTRAAEVRVALDSESI